MNHEQNAGINETLSYAKTIAEWKTNYSVVDEKIQKKKKLNFNRRDKTLFGWLRDKFDPQTSIPRSAHPFPRKGTLHITKSNAIASRWFTLERATNERETHGDGKEGGGTTLKRTRRSREGRGALMHRINSPSCTGPTLQSKVLLIFFLLLFFQSVPF